ncbi:MAG: class I SAM-dependent methyltransferase [Thermodesulfobacteriota bacterium]
MTDDKIYRKIEKLRDPARLAFLETEKVVDLCLQGITAHAVLDVGTGSGIFAEGFAGRGLKVTGVDIQEPMLEAARKYVPGAAFQLASSEKLPFADHTFDLVFLGLVLHESDRHLSTLQESARVCLKRIAVLEWPYKEGGYGPPLSHRIPSGQLHHLAETVGFSRIREIPLTFLILYLLEKE